MYETPIPQDSEVIGILTKHREELLERWSRQQIDSPMQRLDLIEPATLKQQCRELLDALIQVLPAAAGKHLEDDAWQPMRTLLEDISQSRDTAGFPPSDTASFVLSLKQPLMPIVDQAVEEECAEVQWQASVLVDQLAIYTTEVYQARREATIDRQRQEMEELSTPVVKVWDGILAMPLIGTLDTRRSQMVTEALLDALSSSGSEIAIIDLTGVPAVDTRMAQHLIRTVAAARLMGADCILCGIRPQIAQTIVHLQINLGDIVTEASLASALRTAFRRTGLKVIRESNARRPPKTGPGA